MAFSSYSFTINMWTDTDGESDYYGASIDKVERALISSMKVYDSRLVYEYKNRSSLCWLSWLRITFNSNGRNPGEIL
jgi:hypothetical protein